MKKELPSLPRLKKVRRRIETELLETRKLVNVVVAGLVYDELEAYIFDFVTRAEDYCPGIDEIGDGSVVDEEICDEEHKVRRMESVRHILAPLVGQPLAPFHARNLAIRVAGQFEDIRAGNVSAGGWDSTTKARTLLYIQDVHRVPVRGRLYAVEIEAHTGAPAGNRWVCRQTGGFLQHLMRDIGALKYEKYQDSDAAGMWFISDLWYEKGRFCMEEICVASSQKDYNRRLAKARKESCTGPYRPMRGKPCSPCPVDRKLCSLSRYNKAFETLRDCCNGHKGLFRNDEDEFCLSCLIKGIKLDQNYKKSQRDGAEK